MENYLILTLILLIFISNLFIYFYLKRKHNAKILEYNTVAEATLSKHKESKLLAEQITKISLEKETILEETSTLTQSLNTVKENLKIAKNDFQLVKNETKEAQRINANVTSLISQAKMLEIDLEQLRIKKHDASHELGEKESKLYKLLSKIDLYSKIEEFVDNGHFKIPAYLYETSARFVEEIKRTREKQKQLIKDKEAITFPGTIVISEDKSYNQKILNGQVKLMLSSFNIECDFLIGKVSPSTLPRTLGRIEKLANSLEKSAATLFCGFNIKYIELKYQECNLQYQNSLKRKEEQDEQRLIREQIREEQRAVKEFEKAIADAEKEEKMYRNLLEKARKEMDKASEEDKYIAMQRINQLEEQLADAEAKEQRAKSMAEQTKKGHVYVISNIGSFGDKVYKIGLTRRLEPLDRVKELGDASVPFVFDVHAMVYVDDAPALEKALHREFSNVRVNAVNFRKEFFKVDLIDIKKAVEKIAGKEVEFNMTAIAEDYYETRRLQGINNENTL